MFPIPSPPTAKNKVLLYIILKLYRLFNFKGMGDNYTKKEINNVNLGVKGIL